jgi:hypothetical protein
MKVTLWNLLALTDTVTFSNDAVIKLRLHFE